MAKLAITSEFAILKLEEEFTFSGVSERTFSNATLIIFTNCIVMFSETVISIFAKSKFVKSAN